MIKGHLNVCPTWTADKTANEGVCLLYLYTIHPFSYCSLSNLPPRNGANFYTNVCLRRPRCFPIAGHFKMSLKPTFIWKWFHVSRQRSSQLLKTTSSYSKSRWDAPTRRSWAQQHRTAEFLQQTDLGRSFAKGTCHWTFRQVPEKTISN